MKSRQSTKQEISTYRVKGFREVYRHQPPFNLIFFCVIQNILDRSYCITDGSIFDIRTLIMMIMLGRTASSLLAMAFEPIFTSTLISNIGLQLDISLLSLSQPQCDLFCFGPLSFGAMLEFNSISKLFWPIHYCSVCSNVEANYGRRGCAYLLLYCHLQASVTEVCNSNQFNFAKES